MVSMLYTNIAGEEYAQRLLADLIQCCENINNISVSEFYALRLFIRELSINRAENGEEKIFKYFVDSRSFDGDDTKEIEGNKILLEQLLFYRNRKKINHYSILDSFIHTLENYYSY